MSQQTPKLPKPNAVAELRERYNKRKEERYKKHKEFAEILKKKTPCSRSMSRSPVSFIFEESTSDSKYINSN